MSLKQNWYGPETKLILVPLCDVNNLLFYSVKHITLFLSQSRLQNLTKTNETTTDELKNLRVKFGKFMS